MRPTCHASPAANLGKITGLASLLLLGFAGASAAQVNAVWQGTDNSYDNPSNWDLGGLPAAVPINDGTTDYDVFIGASSSVFFDVLGPSNEVQSLSLGTDSSFEVPSGLALNVVGELDANGVIRATGGTLTNTSPLSHFALNGGAARLFATNNGTVTLDGPAVYQYNRTGTEEILAARSGATLSLPTLTSITLNISSGWVKNIVANAGTVNLQNVTTIGAGAGANDGYLDLYYQAGGQINLASLQHINPQAGNNQDAVRFFFQDSDTYNVPASTAVNTDFRLSAGATLDLPNLTEFSGVGF
ncbi:MAG: hypothetical protein AAGJ46_05595, partial [Planctomycetota bacterium]